MKIAIVDDDKEWRQNALRVTKQYFEEGDIVVKCFSSGEALLEKNEKYEIVILDIEMPGRDGFQTACEYKVSYPDVIIIMLTTHLELSRKGYEVDAFRYVDKLHIKEELEAAFFSAKKLLERNKIVEISVVNLGQIPLALKDIIYIETKGRKVLVHTYNNEYECSDSIRSFEENLCGEGFFRCHKSNIVNLDAIKKIDQLRYGGAYAHMADGGTVMIAVRKYAELKKKYINRRYEYANF